MRWVLRKERGRTEGERKWISLPGLFNAHGYTVLGGGKCYHGNLPPVRREGEGCAGVAE